MYHAIVFLPLVGFLIAGLFGRMLGPRPSEIITTGLLFVAAVLSWVSFIQVGFGDGATRIQVAHWMSVGDLQVDWAFRIDTEHGSVAYSGGTEPCNQMVELARDVDVLVHEAAFLDEVIEERGMRGHSGPRGAGRIAQLAGAKKLVLTHLGPYDSDAKAVEMAELYYGRRRGPGIWRKLLQDAATEYNGPIVIGEDAMRFRVSARPA